jgi:hypothetical protein
VGKLYFLDMGFNEPSKLYELVPKEVASFDGKNLHELAGHLNDLKVTNVLVDAPPHVVDTIKLDFNVPQVSSIRYTPEVNHD